MQVEEHEHAQWFCVFHLVFLSKMRKRGWMHFIPSASDVDYHFVADYLAFQIFKNFQNQPIFHDVGEPFRYKTFK